jgi:hypothetical protein
MQLEEAQAQIAELAAVYQNFLSQVIAGKETLTLEQFRSQYRLKYDRHMRRSIDRITEIDVFQPYIHTPEWGHKLFVARIDDAPFLIGLITDREGEDKVASFNAGLPKEIHNSIQLHRDHTYDFRMVRLLEFFKTFITKSERGDPDIPAVPSPHVLFNTLNGFWNRHIQYSGLGGVKAFDLFAVGVATYRLAPVDSRQLVIDITELPSGAQVFQVMRLKEGSKKEYEEVRSFNASVRGGHDFGPVFVNEMTSMLFSLIQDTRMERHHKNKKKGVAKDPKEIASLNRLIQLANLFSMRLTQVSNNFSMEAHISGMRSTLFSEDFE